MNTLGACFESCGRRELADEFGYRELLAILHRLRETKLVDRSPNQRAQRHQAAVKHRAGAPGDADISRLEHLERDDRGVGEISQLMGQEPEALCPAGGFSIEGPLHTDASVLGDGRGDGLVKTSIQRSEVPGADGRVSFHGQLGHGLTDIAVVVHDLGYRHSLNQKVISVQKRASSDLGGRTVFVA